MKLENSLEGKRKDMPRGILLLTRLTCTRERVDNKVSIYIHNLCLTLIHITYNIYITYLLIAEPLAGIGAEFCF